MPASRPAPASNRLIDALPRGDRAQLLAGCERAELHFAQVLLEPGDRIRQVYFPLAGFISLVTPPDGSPGIEVGLVGNEGMVGTTLMLDVATSPLRALVQVAGAAMRMDAAAFRHELDRSAPLRRVLGRYLYVTLAQFAQAAACMRHHAVEARLARWLLMTHDRAHGDAFRVTQETIARMLGVRRVGVTKAAGALQARSLIHYRRGNITVLSRAGLEDAACACYGTGRVTYDRVLGRHRP